MVVPTPSPAAEQELRNLDGQVYAYVVSAARMEQMRAELEALRAQVATLQRQKDHYVAELTDVLRTYIPIPPTGEELKAAVPNSDEIQKLIAELESR